MRLNLPQLSPAILRVAPRSSHSPLPSTWEILESEGIRTTVFGAVSVVVHGSLARASTNVISPEPANDHDDRFSISSSSRESRTFLCNQRYSAPSSYRGTIGMVRAVR